LTPARFANKVNKHGGNYSRCVFEQSAFGDRYGRVATRYGTRNRAM
jgi:hypothetical protein